MPRMTSRDSSANAEPGGSGSCIPAKTTWPSVTVASTTFIDGDPMNAATKRLVGVVEERLRGVALLQHAVAEHRNALTQRHRLHLVVGHVDGRHAEAVVQPRQLRAHRDPQLGVEVRERLVHEERRRLAHHGPAHGDALPLSAGEQRRTALQQRVEPERRRHLPHAAGPLRPRDAPKLEAEAEVLLDRHLRVERVVLEDHRNVAVARSELRDVPVADHDAALRHLLQAGDHPKQRRLAAAGRSDEDHELAVVDVEGHRVEGSDAVRVDLRRPLQPDPGHVRPALPTRPTATSRALRGRVVHRRGPPR